MGWLSLLITGFIFYKFYQKIWIYSRVTIVVILILVYFLPGIIMLIMSSMAFSMAMNHSSVLLSILPSLISILVFIAFLAFVIFVLPKAVLKQRRMKIDAIYNEDERANELVKLYFEYDRKLIGNIAINAIKGIFNRGKVAGGKVAGEVAQGTFNTAGTISGMTGLPGSGLIKSAMGGMGNLANKGIQTVASTANATMNTANAALNNSNTASNTKYKTIDRGVSDEELDEVLKDRMTKLDLLQNGINSLQLDETQISEVPPVCLADYYFDKSNKNLFIAKGNDSIIRTSCYLANCLYFTKEQLSICQYTFDISNGINYQGENTKEYFWQDITDFSSESGGSMQNGQKSIVIKTSGSIYQCAYIETPEIERSIKGMATYYRELKKKLVK